MSHSAADRRRFEIRRCLGAGGFGEVYLGSMVSAGGVRSEVALKVLHQGLDPRSQAIQRLKDEARLLGLLNHPSILKIHDLVLLEDRVTLVTEYIDGADLDQCLADTDPIPLSATLAVVGKVADALNAAYSQPGTDGKPLHLLHRDIKPSNIRIGRHGQVKLLDFGIAKAAGFDREAKTQTNAVVGSFPYMAPERFDDSGDSTASDVYSLGCVLFEALTGGVRLHDEMEVRKLFSLAMVQEKHDAAIEERLAIIRETEPGVMALLREMLAYNLEDRPELATLGLRCEDLSDEISGPSLSRWCRKHGWPAPSDEEGMLSGRTITEASISRTANRLIDSQELPAEQPAARPPPQPTGILTPGAVPHVGGSAPVGHQSTPVSAAPPTWSPGQAPSEIVQREFVQPAPASLPPAPVAAPDSHAERPPPSPAPPPPTTMSAAPPSEFRSSRGGLAALGGLVVLLLAVVGGAALLGGGVLAWNFSGGDEVPAQADPDEPATAVPDQLADGDADRAPDADPAPSAMGGSNGRTVGGGSTPSDGGTDGVADAEVVDRGAAPSKDCGDPVALEPNAIMGKLTADQRACLAVAVRDKSRAQTERGKLGRVLLVDATTRCDQGGGCASYEAEQRYYFVEVDRSDADMLYKWTQYLYKSTSGTDPQLADILLWADRALEVKSQWRGVDYVKRVDSLLEIGAKAAYKRFEGSVKDEKLRGAAKNRSVAWLNNRVQLSKDYAEALQLCASAAGSEEICRKQMFEEKAQATVTLVSIPVGATVTVDGKTEGDCPLVLQLEYGPHEVKMIAGEVTSTQNIKVGSDEATRWMWRSREDRWESSF